MGILASKLTRGSISEPQKLVIYGPEKIGKSTLASQMPNPIFLDTEHGSRRLNVARVDVESLAEFENMLVDPYLLEFSTVIVDTIDWLEQRMLEAICDEAKVSSIEKVGGGYGKGYVAAGERMLKILTSLSALIGKGCNVVLLGHSIVTRFDQPELSSSYDRYELDLNKKHVAPLIKHWADMILFMNWKTRVREVEGLGSNKGIGGDKIVLYCRHCAAFDAGNRHNLAAEESADITTIQKAFANVGAPWGKCASGADSSTKEGQKDDPEKKTNEPKSGGKNESPVPANGAQGEPATAKQKASEGAKKAHETEPEPETPPMTDGLPGLAPDNGGPSVDQFLIVIKGHEEKALAWLRARGRIGANQFLVDVPEDTRKKVLANPTLFLRTIGAADAGKEVA